MSEWSAIGKELVKYLFSPRFAFSTWILCALILFISWPDYFGIAPQVQQHRFIFSLVGLLTFLIWIVEMFLLATSTWSEQREANRQSAEILQYLDSLNRHEANLLVKAVEKKVQTVIWNSRKTEVYSLIAKNLLLKVSDDPNETLKPYTIPPLIWKEIQKEDRLNQLREKAKDSKAETE